MVRVAELYAQLPHKANALGSNTGHRVNSQNPFNGMLQIVVIQQCPILVRNDWCRPSPLTGVLKSRVISDVSNER